MRHDDLLSELVSQMNLVKLFRQPSDLSVGLIKFLLKLDKHKYVLGRVFALLGELEQTRAFTGTAWEVCRRAQCRHLLVLEQLLLLVLKLICLRIHYCEQSVQRRHQVGCSGIRFLAPEVGFLSKLYETARCVAKARWTPSNHGCYES